LPLPIFFAFDDALGEKKKTVATADEDATPVETQHLASPENDQNASDNADKDTNNLSKYNDEKMPYSFYVVAR
jgi:hypothetical protein